jgi:signal peptidase I
MTDFPASAPATQPARDDSPRDAADRSERSADADRRPRKAKPKRGGFVRFLRDVAIILVAAIIISFLIKTFLIRSFYIPSESMESTLIKNDRIIVNELVPDVVGIERGDVVVFKDPGGWLDAQSIPQQTNPVLGFFDWVLSFVGLTSPDLNDHLIKRVIGLPGDEVVCCNEFGQMTINGVPLEETYVKLPSPSSPVSGDDFSVTVPEGSLWVMGDNRYNSRDSRYNQDKPGDGFVPYENVVGRAILITWPIDRWTWLDNYEFVFNGVDDNKADG